MRGEQLEIDVVFDLKDEFAAKIAQKYADGFLHAVSIGFLANAGGVERNGSGFEFKRWELFEVRAVPVPSNRDALAQRSAMKALAEDLVDDELFLLVEEPPSEDDSTIWTFGPAEDVWRFA